MPIIVVTLLIERVAANNIQISDVKSLKELNAVESGYNAVSFTISWDHSWRMSGTSLGNWDAAWIVGKAYTRALEKWRHVFWHTDPLKQTIVSSNVPNMTLRIEEKGKGALLYRSEVGSGSVETDLKMLWNYTAAGFLPDDTVIVSIFAIEMVYIPEGEYLLGDGKSSNKLYTSGNIINLNAGTTLGNKITDSIGYTYAGNVIQSQYPNGFKAFYMMKHEISQHAYVDFINTLTIAQQRSRTAISPESAMGSMALVTNTYSANPKQYRNYIRVRVPANASLFPEQPATYANSVDGMNNWLREDNAGNVACNFLTWEDLLAYADWSCMRPFTELEYEKACRGPKTYQFADYAWGTGWVTYITTYNGKWFMHEDSAREKTAVPMVESQTSLIDGPNAIETGKAPWVMRVGAFAGDSTWRGQAGASWWGVLNMSDNVWERCVNVHTAEGREFKATNGDGEIGASGVATVPDWTSCISVASSILRGFQVSSRSFLSRTATEQTQLNTRHPAVGGRLALTITPALAD